MPLPALADFPVELFGKLRDIYGQFSVEDAARVKEIESVTNHDVKAVEYFIKERFDLLGIENIKEYIHFGLTSQDINNTSVPMSIADAIKNVYRPRIVEMIEHLEAVPTNGMTYLCFAKTHGQPASPTRLGKEIPCVQLPSPPSACNS